MQHIWAGVPAHANLSGMPSLAHYQHRRSQFLDRIDNPVLLVSGGDRSRNYPDNPYPYRPDSNWLFFFASAEPDSAALFDPKDKSVTLFLNDRTASGALWHGAVPGFDEMKVQHGVTHVASRNGLAEAIQQAAGGRRVDSFAVADTYATELARDVTGDQTLAFKDAAKIARPELIQAIGELRARKDEPEIEQMRRTASITKEAHLAAMTHTEPGMLEQELVGLVEGCFARHGCVPAYNTILSVRGEVLHNHDHSNTLHDGDIVLLDGGAENATGYCSDVTRSWPVSGKFSSEAADIYDIVLRAEVETIAAAKPGARYRDLHLLSSRIVAEGLADLGLLRGSVDSLVETGAHAVFFPHGVGHLIGLDVHDMEAFGDAIAYPPGRGRSDQFGLQYLRLDIDLEPGMAFTIEPGIYFVPAILHGDEFRDRFKDQVDFDKAELYLKMNDGRGFGGIRIEDDVLCTADGYEVLTDAIPKDRETVEGLVGSAR